MLTDNRNLDDKIKQIQAQAAGKLAEIQQVADASGDVFPSEFGSIRSSARKILEQIQFLEERQAQRCRRIFLR